jgi:hypothetical protein
MSLPEELVQLKTILKDLEEGRMIPEVSEWLKSISTSEFQLVGSLMQTLKENVKEPTISNDVLKILCQLDVHSHETVHPQLESNEELPEVLKSYIENTPQEELCYDSLVLASDIYTPETAATLPQEVVVNKIFDSIDDIQEESALKPMVLGVVKIFKSQANDDRNEVMLACRTHRNARFFTESLLLVMNRSKGEDRYNILHLLKQLINNEESRERCLYNNDMKSICDMMIQSIENSSSDQDKAEHLRIIYSLLKHHSFRRLNHRTEDLEELLAALETSVDSHIQKLCTKAKNKLLS